MRFRPALLEAKAFREPCCRQVAFRPPACIAWPLAPAVLQTWVWVVSVSWREPPPRQNSRTQIRFQQSVRPRTPLAPEPSGVRNSSPGGWGGWSYEYDKQTHADQGVDADNRCAEAKIGHNGFGSEVKLRDAHRALPSNCPLPYTPSPRWRIVPRRRGIVCT